MQRLLDWLVDHTVITMEYRSHTSCCGRTIAAPTSRELSRLEYEHRQTCLLALEEIRGSVSRHPSSPD